MELSLERIFETLSIGAIAVWIMAQAVRVYDGAANTTHYRRIVTPIRENTTRTVLVALGLMLAMGQIVENFGKSDLSSLGLFSKIVSDDEYHRAAAVSQEDGQPSNLLREVLWAVARADMDEEATQAAKMMSQQLKDRPITVDIRTDNRARNAVQELYYVCKNKACRDPVFAAELMLVERRLTFARSICLLAVFGSIIHLLSLIAAFVARARTKKAPRAKGWPALLWPLGVLLLASWATSRAHHTEYQNYCKRVFGYGVECIITTESARSSESNDAVRTILESLLLLVKVR